MIITLIEPQIPPNTGNIARLCAATKTRLEIVGDIGFSLSNKYLKRAGLDYWEYLDWEYFPNVEEYIEERHSNQIHLFTTKVTKSYTTSSYNSTDYLIFGSETKGINETYLMRFQDRCRTIPMFHPNVRSLNLSSSVSIVLYEALRQQGTV